MKESGEAIVVETANNDSPTCEEKGFVKYENSIDACKIISAKVKEVGSHSYTVMTYSCGSNGKRKDEQNRKTIVCAGRLTTNLEECLKNEQTVSTHEFVKKMEEYYKRPPKYQMPLFNQNKKPTPNIDGLIFEENWKRLEPFEVKKPNLIPPVVPQK